MGSTIDSGHYVYFSFNIKDKKYIKYNDNHVSGGQFTVDTHNNITNSQNWDNHFTNQVYIVLYEKSNA